MGYHSGVPQWGTTVRYHSGVPQWGTTVRYHSGVPQWGTTVGYHSGGGVGISISILKHDFSEIEIEKIEKIEKIKNLLKSFFRLTQFTDQSIMFRLPLKLRIQECNNLYVSLLLGHYR